LDKGDLIIDAGNSYFKDTNLRASNLAEKGIHFLGVGVSGGEEGARNGPSIMPGGPKAAYERVRPVFEAAAAKVDGDPCVTWLAPARLAISSRWCTTAIEYAMMQLIAEGLSNKEIAQRLYIEVQTVKNHVHNILDKLQLHNRLEAVQYAREKKCW
jgi:6-phosphogluconate dehydrogenase